MICEYFYKNSNEKNISDENTWLLINSTAKFNNIEVYKAKLFDDNNKLMAEWIDGCRWTYNNTNNGIN